MLYGNKTTILERILKKKTNKIQCKKNSVGSLNNYYRN